MKLTATIRPTATKAIEATGDDYVTVREQLLASVPAGYEIVSPISTVHENVTAGDAAHAELASV